MEAGLHEQPAESIGTTAAGSFGGRLQDITAAVASVIADAEASAQQALDDARRQFEIVELELHRQIAAAMDDLEKQRDDARGLKNQVTIERAGRARAEASLAAEQATQHQVARGYAERLEAVELELGAARREAERLMTVIERCREVLRRAGRSRDAQGLASLEVDRRQRVVRAPALRILLQRELERRRRGVEPLQTAGALDLGVDHTEVVVGAVEVRIVRGRLDQMPFCSAQIELLALCPGKRFAIGANPRGVMRERSPVDLSDGHFGEDAAGDFVGELGRGSPRFLSRLAAQGFVDDAPGALSEASGKPLGWLFRSS